MRFGTALVVLLLVPGTASAVTTNLVLQNVKVNKVDIPAIQGGSNFGHDVAGLGDVNGDGNLDSRRRSMPAPPPSACAAMRHSHRHHQLREV